MHSREIRNDIINIISNSNNVEKDLKLYFVKILNKNNNKNKNDKNNQLRLKKVILRLWPEYEKMLEKILILNG